MDPLNQQLSEEELENGELDPNAIPPNSPKSFIWLLVISICIGLFGITGYLLFQEYQAPSANDAFTVPTHPAPPDYKAYSNDFWGIRFEYPGSWTPVIGSFDDGLYYFASQPINFISELDAGQALVVLKTYNNWKKEPFSDWLADQEQNYFPAGDVQKTAANFQGLPAEHYYIQLKVAQNNTQYWDMWVISRTTASIYELILETDNQKTHQEYEQPFNNILDSVQFYGGYGTEENR